MTSFQSGFILFSYNQEIIDPVILSLLPVVTYLNADTQKLDIIKDNKQKCGVYKWTNLETNEFYVGSSVNLRIRFNQYYNLTFIIKYAKSSIFLKALLKYGYSKFRLDIIEYCDKEIVLDREQFYIDTLKPTYNILKNAKSSLGYLHTKEAKEKMRLANLGRKHSDATLAKFKLRKHSAEAIAKMKMRKHSEESKLKMSNTLGTKVILTDTLTNTIIEFSSMNKAAKHINVSPNLLFERRKILLNNGIPKLIQKRYKMELKKDE